MIPSSGLSYLKEDENSIERQTEARFPEGHRSGLELLMNADLQQVMDSRRHTGTRVFGFYCRTSYTWWLGYIDVYLYPARGHPGQQLVQCRLACQKFSPILGGGTTGYML